MSYMDGITKVAEVIKQWDSQMLSNKETWELIKQFVEDEEE